MALQELESHISGDNEKYGAPELDDFPPENSSENEFNEAQSESFDHETGDPGNRHRSTGPRSLQGKAISSQNATKHGCRSKTLILRHEDPAEYEALHKSWWDEHQPLGQSEETLVQLLIDNHWFLKRAGKRMEQVELELPENVYEWTDAHKKLISTFQRYKTTAERAYYKSFREVEGHFRECVRAENAAHKAGLLRLKIEAQIANKPNEARQIALKMATPLYRNRADARAKMQSTKPEIRPLAHSDLMDVFPPHNNRP